MQIESFFKKNEVFSDPEVCLQAAAKTFKESELRCKRANRRLDFYYVHRDRLDPDMDLWMKRAEAYIRRVLGPFDVFLNNLPRFIRLTSGATSNRSRRESLPYLKVRKRLNCPISAEPYLQSLSRFYGVGPLRIRYSDINRVEAVPKNWKTHRLIACEPEGALPLQLAFDTFTKERLRLFGINLSDQIRNQELSRIGSLDDSLATIDLSAASDTLAYNTVAWLLPEQWFKYLSSVRSRTYKGVFGIGKYHKFSSMGNGATFALETLIFASACFAVGSKRFSVYGDDIIIESELAPKLMRFLRFLGFIPNPDKSYYEGPFRESCGTHWFRGVEVTPFYLRTGFKRKPDLCHAVNGLATISLPGGRMWEFLKDLLRSRRLPFTPFNENSTSGVWIDIHSSYAKGLIKTKDWVAKYKSYASKTSTIEKFDSRTYFLWHLDRYYKSRRFADDISIRALGLDRHLALWKLNQTSELITSRVPLTDHRYVRKWVHWYPPVSATPDHLYWWSEYVLAP